MDRLTEAEANAFFVEFYRGEHHLPAKIRPYGTGWSIIHTGPLATFDSDELTRLVFAAHVGCIRVQVEQGGPNRLRIAIWRRQRDGSMFERHPTIVQAFGQYVAGGRV